MNPLDELKSLTDQFPDCGTLFENVEHVPPAVVPEAYRRLLVHDHHMTVTMESHHHSSVDVKVLDSRYEGDIYSRKILLLLQGTTQPVHFGIVRFDFRYVTQAVRDKILEGKTPLGRVLINHNVLRHIDLGAVLRISAGKSLAEVLDMPTGGITYGRLATIFCNQRPAVDLLEISAPLEETA